MCSEPCNTASNAIGLRDSLDPALNLASVYQRVRGDSREKKGQRSREDFFVTGVFEGVALAKSLLMNCQGSTIRLFLSPGSIAGFACNLGPQADLREAEPAAGLLPLVFSVWSMLPAGRVTSNIRRGSSG